jgi:hypothetical protein
MIRLMIGPADVTVAAPRGRVAARQSGSGRSLPARPPRRSPDGSGLCPVKHAPPGRIDRSFDQAAVRRCLEERAGTAVRLAIGGLPITGGFLGDLGCGCVRGPACQAQTEYRAAADSRAAPKKTPTGEWVFSDTIRRHGTTPSPVLRTDYPFTPTTTRRRPEILDVYFATRWFLQGGYRFIDLPPAQNNLSLRVSCGVTFRHAGQK